MTTETRQAFVEGPDGWRWEPNYPMSKGRVYIGAWVPQNTDYNVIASLYTLPDDVGHAMAKLLTWHLKQKKGSSAQILSNKTIRDPWAYATPQNLEKLEAMGAPAAELLAALNKHRRPEFSDGEDFPPNKEEAP